MSKGGSKQCFIMPPLAAGTNSSHPARESGRWRFYNEGFSQRLWGLMCSLPGPSIFCPSIQPVAEMLDQTLRLTVIGRLSMMQVRAGVLQVPPALVISCCT